MEHVRTEKKYVPGRAHPTMRRLHHSTPPQTHSPLLPRTQATFLETGSGEEGFVQLAGTGSWVVSRRGQEAKMVRLPAFPAVDKTPRKFVVSATDGVETIVGPSSSAPRTGHVLPLGTEGRSEMMWSVEGWPKDRGMGDTRFVLLEEMGWVQLKGTTVGAVEGSNGAGVSGDVLREIAVASAGTEGTEESVTSSVH